MQADAPVLGTGDFGRGGSSPLAGTTPSFLGITFKIGGVAELVDAADLKFAGRNPVGVQAPQPL